MLRASLVNPRDEQVEEAKRDFEPYLTRFAGRLQQPEEVEAWGKAEVAEEDRGVKLHGSGWEDKREAEMKRANPKFILRQWVLEELITKLEDTGVDRIEEGRRELAKLLDVRVVSLLPGFAGFRPLKWRMLSRTSMLTS